MWLGNDYYYYFGTVWINNDSTFFKNNKGKFHGCQQVLYSIREEENYSFDKISSNQLDTMLYAYDDKISKRIASTKKKTVIFEYNYSAEKVFFKDIKPILEYVASEGYDFVILATDFY